MKKVIAVLLAALMLASLFACSGGGGNEPAAAPSDSPASPASSPASSAPPAPPAETAPEPARPTGTQPVAPEVAVVEDKYGGILRIVNSAEGGAPIGIPWSVSTLENLLKPPFFECLLAPTTLGELQPRLAESWTVDMANNEIVFNIRPGIKFHDGSDFTAEVAAWNIMMGVNSLQWNQSITECEARGDYVLAVKYDVWSNAIIFGMASYYMCSKESYEKNGEEWAAENPIGTGPFVMTEYIHGQYIKGVRNDNYWQEGKPYLDGVEFHFIRDPVAQSMALQATGDQRIDVLNLNSAEEVSNYINMGYDTYILYTGPVALFPSSMDDNSPLSILEVRQAISYALDREALCAARGFGIATPGTQWVESNSIAHLPDSYNQSYDPDKAKELLAQAGYPDGFHTTLISQPGVADRDSTVAIQAMLEAVGITSDIEFPDSGAYSSLRAAGWDGICVAGARQFAFVYNSFYLYFDWNQMFYVSVKRPDGWEETLRAAEQTPEPEQDKLQAVHAMLLDNMIAIPVYNITDNWVFQDNVYDTYYGIYDTSAANLADAWMS